MKHNGDIEPEGLNVAIGMEDNVGNNLLALPGKATVKVKYKV